MAKMAILSTGSGCGRLSAARPRRVRSADKTMKQTPKKRSWESATNHAQSLQFELASPKLSQVDLCGWLLAVPSWLPISDLVLLDKTTWWTTMGAVFQKRWR